MTYPATKDALTGAHTNDPDAALGVAAVQTAHQPDLTAQTVVFAAAITPDPSLGATINVGALTANITINNPAVAAQVPGRKLTFVVQQDATGSRTVTWGNKFRVLATATPVTPSKFSTIVVQWDGAFWTQIGGVPAVA